MSHIAIKVENVSKLYRLGQVGTGTLKNDLNRFWHKVRGKEDPYLKIGQTNDRTKKAESEFAWALKDINFEVKQGEAIGIIGRNGAGKSTLLKILSKITSPTTGQIHINGRIASLLEVGTGFHPELSGKENIFMNGAILGMKKWEIQQKFDEIVDFAGVEAYVDTPVKRYSSGMIVRLGFAVAAHLEPEILIVDEVLAVGDAEFQKKCIGKMQDVSTNQGRTVLFVSHNMAAVKNLCSSGVLLKNGQLTYQGKIDNVIDHYLSNSQNNNRIDYANYTQRKGNGSFKITDAFFSQKAEKNVTQIVSLSKLDLNLEYQLSSGVIVKSLRIDIGINDLYGARVAWLSTWNVNFVFDSSSKSILFEINNFNLSPGEYTCNIFCVVNEELSDWLEGVLPFSVIETDYYNSGKIIPKNQGGLLFNYTIKNQ
jgi:lipopolysaccharide transport system ATP-binding protein